MSANGQTQAGSGGAFDMIRPHHIPSLPMLNDLEKQKYQQGLAKLWTTVETAGPDSENHRKAVDKIKEVSRDLMVKIARHRAGASQQAAANRPQGQQPAQAAQQLPQQAPQQQQAQDHTMAQSQQAQQQQQYQQNQQQQQQQHQSSQQQQQQQQQQQYQLSAVAKNFLQSFKVCPPPNIQPTAPEFDAYKARTIRNLNNVLVANDRATAKLKEYGQREASGQELTPEMVQQREQAKGMIATAKTNLDTIRTENERNKMHWTAKQGKMDGVQMTDDNSLAAGMVGAQGQMPQQIQTQAQQAQLAQQMRQPMQNQQQPGMLNVNTGMDNSQGIVRTSMSPAVGAPFQNNQGQPGASQMHAPQQQQQSQMQMPQQGQNHNAMAQGRPQPIPQQQPYAQQHQNQQHQSSNNAPQMPPQPLSHQAAMSAAARTYSEQQQRQQPQRATPTGSGAMDGTVAPANVQPAGQGQAQGPGSAGATFPSISSAATSVNSKMPIPKQLNVASPSPVSMGPSRPTFGGAGNGPPGMMGQPAITKHPGFILEGEGDRVLSKKKLDELVRQVTGGGEGDGLTADVEEAVLTLADDFVDDLITSACRLAKIRPNSTLDIRDIQIILERNYNIRVPGYSLDEIRTVRKFQPAPGWTQKMNAVQAAKVMGKNDG